MYELDTDLEKVEFTPDNRAFVVNLKTGERYEIDPTSDKATDQKIINASRRVNSIETAIRIALDAHQGQVDKGGETYILHPLRLMGQANTKEERIVALLHDVVEDSSYTLDDLRKQGFSDSVIDALECLTKKEGEDYDDFIERISRNQLATRVKILDMRDNSDLSRLKSISSEDRERAAKYNRSIAKLEAILG